MTVGKRVGGFVLQVAARVVSKHSLNVMAGHDDVYALLQSGYTILFGSNPQEAADLAAISYKVSATSLIPVANAMDGFATSHMLSEALMPEPELLREFLGDPAGRIKCPTVAQEILFGAKGRVFQLEQYLTQARGRHRARRHRAAEGLSCRQRRRGREGQCRRADRRHAGLAAGGAARPVAAAVAQRLREGHPPARAGAGRRPQSGPDRRRAEPARLPGRLRRPPHPLRARVPRFVREAMAEYSALTGREYKPVHDLHVRRRRAVMVGLGSVTDDAEAVAAYLRSQGKKVGVVSIKLLQPFPEAELVAALAGKKAVTVLERSDVTALTTFVTQALFKGVENAERRAPCRHPGDRQACPR